MALTEQQVQDKADNEAALKISIEAMLLPTLQSLFDKIVNDVGQTFSDSGTVPDATSYKNDFNNWYTSAYETTSAQFKDASKSEMQQTEASTPNFNAQSFVQNVQAQAETAIASFITLNSAANANEVTGTNQNNIDDALAFAIAAQAANQLSRAETTKQLTNKLSQLFDGRTDTILITTVQSASEGTKQTVVESYSDALRAVDPSLTGAVKIWVTKMDDKVRESHQLANFQTQPSGTPFTVQGEKLNYPGDGSLGASLDNIINCRCVSVFTL